MTVETSTSVTLQVSQDSDTSGQTESGGGGESRGSDTSGQTESGGGGESRGSQVVNENN